MKDIKEPDYWLNLTVEEFDALEETHTFSDDYKRRKSMLLERLRHTEKKTKKLRVYRVAAAVACLVLCSPFVIYAAVSGKIFNRIWGNEAKSDIEQHKEEIYEPEKGTSYIVTLPRQEFDGNISERAAEMVEASMSYETLSYDMGDGTTITVFATVRDSHAAVIAYTLEKEGGVDCLNYGLYENEVGGAWLKKEVPFYYLVCGGGNCFVDLEQSTDDKLVCYEYVVVNPRNFCDIGQLSLIVTQYLYDEDIAESIIAENSKHEGWDVMLFPNTPHAKMWVKTEIPLPENTPLEEHTFSYGESGTISLSPIAMYIDAGIRIDDMKYIKITYRDGSEYVVCDSRPSEEVEICNMEYICGSADLLFEEVIFNRLVDPYEISSITINDCEFLP